MPLVGLGSDQVEKATWIEHNVEAYHADEHKKGDATLLIKRLLGMSEEEVGEITVLLYLSPRALSKDSDLMSFWERPLRLFRRLLRGYWSSCWSLLYCF